MQTEVQNIISKARGQMRTTPEDAIQSLRLELDKVKQLPELTPEARDQFVTSLESALREGYRQKTEVEQRRQEDMERRAKARENALVVQGLVRDQQKVKQLIDRVDFLLEEARLLEGEERGQEIQRRGRCGRHGGWISRRTARLPRRHCSGRTSGAITTTT